MESIRKPVFLPKDLARDIKSLYEQIHDTQHGAFQDTLVRGAELAVEEMRTKLAATPQSVPDLEQKKGLKDTHPAENGDSLISLCPEGRQWVMKLVRVLESKHEVAIRAITENLIAFEMLACVTDGAETAAGNASEASEAFDRRLEGVFDRANKADGSAKIAIRDARRSRSGIGSNNKKTG